MVTTTEQVSIFAQIVDGLRGKSEEELRLLYIKFFRDDLVKKWEDLTSEMSFGEVTEEDVIKAMQKKNTPKNNSESHYYTLKPIAHTLLTH
jgi:hypothetical protein